MYGPRFIASYVRRVSCRARLFNIGQQQFDLMKFSIVGIIVYNVSMSELLYN